MTTDTVIFEVQVRRKLKPLDGDWWSSSFPGTGYTDWGVVKTFTGREETDARFYLSYLRAVKDRNARMVRVVTRIDEVA